MSDVSGIKNNVEEVTYIAMEDLVKAPWNPQEQTTETFNSLCEEIENEGFDEPLLVIPHPTDDGKYMVIAGNHRYDAAKTLSMKELPCIVKDWDEEQAKLKAVQRNLLKGDLDEAKFNSLVNNLKTDYDLTDEQIAEAMAFDSLEDFYSMYHKEEGERHDKEEKAVRDAHEDIEQELDMVDNVGVVINEIFGKHGDTVEQGFIYFMHKKKVVLCVTMDDNLTDTVKGAVEHMKATGESSSRFFEKAIKSVLT